MDGAIDPSIFPDSACPFDNYCDGFFNFLSIFSLKLTAALDIPNQQFNSCTKIDSTFFPTIAVRGQWALTRATLSRTAPKVFTKLQIYIFPIHVVIVTLISILATENIQKRRGQALLFSFEYNLSPNLTSK